jgi:hypothetical protein
MMLPLASVLFAYTGVAAAVAARLRSAPLPPAARPALFAIAAAAIAAAVALWPRSDGAILTGVSVTLAVSAMATLIVLLAPLVPKLVWTVAVAAPVLAVVLAILA